MQKLNIIVIDGDKKHNETINKFFKGDDKIKILKFIENGKEALEYIKENRESIDLIVMDILLKEVDGISILEHLLTLEKKIPVIITTEYNMPYLLQNAKTLGINYYMLKPINLNSLRSRIFLSASNHKEDLEKQRIEETELEFKISFLLHKLGISSKMKGYRYLKKGIGLLYKTPEGNYNLTNYTYKYLANYYNSTKDAIEKSIRVSIENGFDKSDKKVTQYLFGNSINNYKNKPTNAEFMYTIVEALRINNPILQEI